MEHTEEKHEMDRAAILALQNEFVADFVKRAPAEPDKTYRFRLTSGTTGASPILMVHEIHPAAIPEFSETQRRLVVGGSRMINLSQALFIRRSGVENQSIMFFGMAPDTPDTSSGSMGNLASFSPTVVNAFPAALLYFGAKFSQRATHGVEKIITIGEAITPVVETRLRAMFPNARILANYGNAEIGLATYNTCAYCPVGVYHPLPDVICEIDKPDESGMGEILVTREVYHGRKVERYHTGDLGILTHTQCACGQQVSLQVLGRNNYDVIRAGGMLFRIEEFDRVMALVPKLAEKYVAEVYERPVKNGSGVSIAITSFREKGELSSAECEQLRAFIAEHLYVSLRGTLATAMKLDGSITITVSSSAKLPEKNGKNIRLKRRV